MSVVSDDDLYDMTRECEVRVFASAMKTGLVLTFYTGIKRENSMSALQSSQGRMLWTIHRVMAQGVGRGGGGHLGNEWIPTAKWPH